MKFTKENIIEANFKQRKKFLSLEKKDFKILEKYDCFVAGGAILSSLKEKEINDYDIYFKNKADFIKCLNDFEHLNIISYTDRQIMLKNKFQLIYFKFFNSPAEIFKTFDFSCCMCCYSLKTKKVYYHKEFLRTMTDNCVLINQKTPFPINSLLRIKKYRDKGFIFNQNEIIKLSLSVMNLKINSWEDVKTQLGGAYGLNLSEKITSQKYSEKKLIELLNEENILINESIDLEKIIPNQKRKEFILDILKKLYSDEEELEVFKIVSFKNKQYHTFFENHFFHYKLHEIIRPHNPENKNSGIYFSLTKPKLNFNYERLIKLKVKIKDIKIRMYNFCADKVFFAEILE